MTKDFMKQVLEGKKELIPLSVITPITVPAYNELKLESVYDNALKLPDMAQHFPDKYPKNRHCDKKYFWVIFNTIHPDVVKEMLDHANRQRYSIASDKLKGEAVKVTDEWNQ